ncbi:unnamed protein product [Mytilus coruscus]|uniref:Aspartic peptidase DDI1-type domain-containing protein n=1 Tax=Mytilus coruscus TaxID=42192 RepID=A0A6J8BT17_MYTCO|nr:unnamed protein product [Mytilus coruscus]
MSNIDDQIAERSRQIQSLSESTIQHGQGFISSTPRDQGVRPKVVENKEHDSGVVTTGPSLSTPELGLSVRRLSNLAYPTAPLELRDTLDKEQFFKALVDIEMRLRIKQSRAKGLNDAIRLAVELEAYNKAESRTMKSMGHLRQTTSDERTEASNSPDTAISIGQMATWIQTIENNLQSLTKELRDLKFTRMFQPRGKIKKTQLKIQSTEGTHKKELDTDGTVNTLKSEVKSLNAVVVSASEDAGMFVELSIQDVPVQFVVDNGGTLTLVSTRVYDLIPDLYRPHMSKNRSQIKSVCDNYLSLGGKGSFTLDFGKKKFTSEAVVTDLQVDGILGLDFMKKNKCLIDVSANLLHIDNFKVPLLFQGTQNRNADVHRKR